MKNLLGEEMGDLERGETVYLLPPPERGYYCNNSTGDGKIYSGENDYEFLSPSEEWTGIPLTFVKWEWHKQTGNAYVEASQKLKDKFGNKVDHVWVSSELLTRSNGPSEEDYKEAMDSVLSAFRTKM